MCIKKKSLNNSVAFPDLEKKLKRAAAAENPNLSTLSGAITERLDGEWDTSRVMVFVRTRATCQALCSWLNSSSVLPELQHLKASPFTGAGAYQDEGGEGEPVVSVSINVCLPCPAFTTYH